MSRAPASAAASQSSSNRAILRSFSNMVGSNWTVATLCTRDIIDPSDQKRFLDRGAHRVFWIHHVAEPDAAGLRQQHVGVDLLKAVIGGHPAAQFAIGDARSILHRPRRADRHDEVL